MINIGNQEIILISIHHLWARENNILKVTLHNLFQLSILDFN